MTQTHRNNGYSPARPSSSAQPISSVRLDAPELAVVTPGDVRRAYPLPADGGSLRLGRSRLSEVRVTDAFVSSAHLRFDVAAGAVTVHDLGSRHGTLLNGQRLDPHTRRTLRDGDEIRIGQTVVRFVRYQEKLERVLLTSRPPTQGPPESVAQAVPPAGEEDTATMYEPAADPPAELVAPCDPPRAAVATPHEWPWLVALVVFLLALAGFVTYLLLPLGRGVAVS